MICASVYLLAFTQNLLVRLAEKIRLSQPVKFGGGYPTPHGCRASFKRRARGQRRCQPDAINSCRPTAFRLWRRLFPRRAAEPAPRADAGLDRLRDRHHPTPRAAPLPVTPNATGSEEAFAPAHAQSRKFTFTPSRSTLKTSCLARVRFCERLSHRESLGRVQRRDLPLRHAGRRRRPRAEDRCSRPDAAGPRRTRTTADLRHGPSAPGGRSAGPDARPCSPRSDRCRSRGVGLITPSASRCAGRGPGRAKTREPRRRWCCGGGHCVVFFGPTTAKCAPWGSVAIAMKAPPGTSCGPWITRPPPASMRAIASVTPLMPK